MTYAWVATSGSFGDPTAQNPTFTCATAGPAALTLTASDGDTTTGCPATLTTTDVIDGGPPPVQALVTTIDNGVVPTVVTINQGTAIGEGSLNGATPFMVTNLAADPNNTQTIAANDGGPSFLATGHVPDPAFGFCNYPRRRPPPPVARRR
ncbi:MAG TPA: hypothetical protein VKU41_07760 [Polyangiaceae bacterium]|nr:hypothetical protein [Polyangiaceae bacterium]